MIQSWGALPLSGSLTDEFVAECAVGGGAWLEVVPRVRPEGSILALALSPTLLILTVMKEAAFVLCQPLPPAILTLEPADHGHNPLKP